ncbi:hypothetical protein AURDEDRAFT_173608 [Auricularia subglabra TFB-10046 SS5]|uniref:Uncharacterized protein n=1 Tax=Auricularia subglabra (strain TFB-10046 / SS5) TaxID=717982 RepID=J0WU96_AURST|nr:hypothetical protein AURDEDRAFT_173608 [Auricularia subglabra TFB-10046 SS5]
MSALRKLFRSSPANKNCLNDEDIFVVPFSESPFRVPNGNAGSASTLSDAKGHGWAAAGDSKAHLPLLDDAFPVKSDAIAMVDRSPGVPGSGSMTADEKPASGRPAESSQSGPPSWLGIFFDLAWTATFSNLTSNTELTSFSTLFSYAVFFMLAWWLWTAQVTYDTKHFRNDIWHRSMLLVQLTIFGALSAFTKDFNPFSKHIDPRQSQIEDYDQYSRKSMLGISGLFACARFFLAASYFRVLLYLPKRISNYTGQRRRLLFRIYTYSTSCVLFAVAFAVVKLDRGFSSLPTKLALWFSAIAIEIISYLTVPDVDPDLLLNEDTLGERLSTLTSIILGEGLNGFAGALIFGATSIGFNGKTGGVAASSVVVVTFAFLLYFDGFKHRTLSTHNRSRWNVILHFPLHLALIVLLEALKNTLLYCSLSGVIDALFYRYTHVKGDETRHDAYVALFRDVGLDLEKILNKSIAAIEAQDSSVPQEELLHEVNNKATALLILSLIEAVNLDTEEIRENITEYVNTIGGAARTDTRNFTFASILDARVAEIQVSAMWILLSSAVFLACLALITLVNSWRPKCGHVWISIVTRATTAVIVGLLSFLARNPVQWQEMQDKALMGAFAAVAFVAQVIVDHVIIWITRDILDV